MPLNLYLNYLLIIIKIAKTSETMTYVRWNSSGDLLASSSNSGVVNVIDLKTEKLIYSGITSDKSKKQLFLVFMLIKLLEQARSVCFC